MAAALLSGAKFARRDNTWIRNNLEELAELHTNLMKRSWGEDWSNDPAGTDTRTNSVALWRQYMDQQAVVFSAEQDDRIIGAGVLIQLRSGVFDLEWVRRIFEAGLSIRPQQLDWEFAMALVTPEFEGNGIFSTLAEMRMNYCMATARKGERLWVQTLASGEKTARVRQYYTKRGFESAGELDIKGTRRVFLYATQEMD